MTQAQKNLLEAIRRLTVDGVSPSYEDLAAAVGLKSKSGVVRMVDQLEHAGLIRRRRGRARSIVINAGPYSPEALDGLPTCILRDVANQAADILAQRVARC